MIVEVYWLVVTFPDGSRKWAVIDDPVVTVQFYGRDAAGKQQYFEAEGYHLGTWCQQHSFKYESGKMAVTLPVEKT